MNNSEALDRLIRQRDINETNLKIIKKIYEDETIRYHQLNQYFDNELKYAYSHPDYISNPGVFFPKSVLPLDETNSTRQQFKRLPNEADRILKNSDIYLVNQNIVQNVDAQRKKQLDELKLLVNPTAIPNALLTTPSINTSIITSSPRNLMES
jgi:hypothetical protein